jgi:hypothetical protein
MMMEAELLAIANMLDAVVCGASEEFVRVPYGASHEDVAAINEWHQMANEARAALRDYKRSLPVTSDACFCPEHYPKLGV